MKDQIDPLELFASKLAEFCNGGSWWHDYTEEQKQVWIDRAVKIRQGKFWKEGASK